LRLLSPILPHTTTEAYDYVTGKRYDDIYLEEMPFEQELSDVQLQLEANWDNFMKYRDLVLKALEDARNAKVIGKSLTEGRSTEVARQAEVEEVTSINIRPMETLELSRFQQRVK
jgi:isoleucyl-tRNA synthetase